MHLVLKNKGKLVKKNSPARPLEDDDKLI